MTEGIERAMEVVVVVVDRRGCFVGASCDGSMESDAWMLDSLVVSVGCDGLAPEPSADLRVWLVNEVPARRVSPAAWL